MLDRNADLVGRLVVYRGSHPGAEPEQGMVTSINAEANIVFVRFNGITSEACTADDRLTHLDGSPVELPAVPTEEQHPTHEDIYQAVATLGETALGRIAELEAVNAELVRALESAVICIELAVPHFKTAIAEGHAALEKARAL